MEPEISKNAIRFAGLLEYLRGRVASQRTALRLAAEVSRDMRCMKTRTHAGKQREKRKKRKSAARESRQKIREAEKARRRGAEEEPRTARSPTRIKGPGLHVESDDPYVTTVKPPKTEEVDAPVVSMLP